MILKRNGHKSVGLSRRSKEIRFNVLYIPNDDAQNYSFCRLKRYYKTLGISVINSLMSSPFLGLSRKFGHVGIYLFIRIPMMIRNIFDM